MPFYLGWGVVLTFVIAWAVFGAIVGAVAGLCTAAVLRTVWSGVWQDAIIGGIALPGAIVFFAFLPWPRNTITYTLRGGTTVTSTMNRFQHDEGLGWTLAALLPIANEVRRRTARTP